MSENIAKNDIIYSNQAMPKSFNFEFIKKRTKDVICNRDEIWIEIKQEYADIKALYFGYFIYVALVPLSIYILHNITSSISTIFYAILALMLSCGIVFLSAFLIVKISPRFKVNLDIVTTLKLLVFSSTPVFLVSIFDLVPIGLVNSLLHLLSVAYAVYLIWVALPIITDVALDNRQKFYCAVLSVIFGIPFVLAFLFPAIMIGAK